MRDASSPSPRFEDEEETGGQPAPAEHYQLLLDGDLDSACRMLETHLHRSMRPNIEMVARHGRMPDEARLPYLPPAECEGGGKRNNKAPGKFARGFIS